MINVQLEPDAPITQMDEALLRRKDIYHDCEHEMTTAIEYWLDDRCVHRSVHVTLKQGLSLTAVQGVIGG